MAVAGFDETEISIKLQAHALPAKSRAKSEDNAEGSNSSIAASPSALSSVAADHVG